MTVLENHTELKRKANKIVRFRTLLATGAGFIPVPMLDAAGILTVQVWMIRDLSKLYNIPFKRHVVKSLIGTLVGNIGSAGVIKFIPGLGTLLGGGAVAATGATATYALGKIFTQHFDQGGTLLSFDPVKSQEHFRQVYEEGRTTVQQLQAQGLHSQTMGAQNNNAELEARVIALQNELEERKKEEAAAAEALRKKKRRRARWRWSLFFLLLLAGAVLLFKLGYFTFPAGKKLADPELNIPPPASTGAIGPAATAPPDTLQAGPNLQGAANATSPDASALGFAPGSDEAQIADFLGSPQAVFPKTFPLDAVQFEEGGSELDEKGSGQLANIAKILESYPDAKIRLYGHADQTGGLAANRQAGMLRAKAMENLLKQQGIAGGRVAVSYMEIAAPGSQRGAAIELLSK